LLVAAGLIALSMAAYAALGARRDPDAQQRESHFLMGTGDFLVHWFLWLIGPFERAALALGWRPIVFNFIGLAFGAATGLFFALGRFPWAAWGLAAGGLCDILDGRVARATRTTSKSGAFIDSSLDRFVEVFAFLGLVLYFRDRPAGVFAAAAAMAGSLLVSYTRARGESLGVLCKEGLMQRAERLASLFLASVFDAPCARLLERPPGTLVLWTCALIAFGTILTAAHRTWWIAARLDDPR
jgi:CDP-diacylglycerol---glycerol-3-phosphate 3-phosphatidyltransferase